MSAVGHGEKGGDMIPHATLLARHCNLACGAGVSPAGPAVCA